MTQYTLDTLLNTLPQKGEVCWIGLRPERRAKLDIVSSVEASSDFGLIGDRYSGKSGKRQITLIQAEHLAVIASVLGIDDLDPSLLRRNISVSGINLLSLKDKQFSIGNAILEFTGLCHPCSLMEQTLGEGGYNAVRGHGGITTRVVQSGKISVGDTVRTIDRHEYGSKY